MADRVRACKMKACMELYRATGKDAYRACVLKEMENSMGDVTYGTALFFALEQTGDERFRLAIEELAAQKSSWQMDAPEDMFFAQPFLMAYEMRLGRMAHVADVAAPLKAVDGEKLQGDSLGWYLMTLIDCISLLDEQLYEHYRALVDAFRRTLRTFVPKPTISRFSLKDTRQAVMLAYAVLKGARLGVINGEKYLPAWFPLAENLIRQKSSSSLDEGLLMLLRAQCLMAQGWEEEAWK